MSGESRTTREHGAVLAAAERLLSEGGDAPHLRSLLLEGLHDLWDGFSGRAEPGCILLPRLVHAGIRGDEGGAPPLVATCALLYLAVGALDDLMDGDEPRAWRRRERGEVLLAATTLLASVVPRALGSMGATAAASRDLLRIWHEAAARMAGGQLADLRARGPAVRPSGVIRAVEQKSGEFAGLLAGLASRAAGASRPIVAHYAEFGRALGTADQIRTDYLEALVDRSARDLARGAWTLPVALHFGELEPSERERFLGLLSSARTSAAARQRVRAELFDGRSTAAAEVLLGCYRLAAHEALEAARPHEPAAAVLRTMIRAQTFVGPPRDTSHEESHAP